MALGLGLTRGLLTAAWAGAPAGAPAGALGWKTGAFTGRGTLAVPGATGVGPWTTAGAPEMFIKGAEMGEWITPGALGPCALLGAAGFDGFVPGFGLLLFNEVGSAGFAPLLKPGAFAALAGAPALVALPLLLKAAGSVPAWFAPLAPLFQAVELAALGFVPFAP